MQSLAHFAEHVMPRLDGAELDPTVCVYRGGHWCFIVEHPLLFNVRAIPPRYLGFLVDSGVPSTRQRPWLRRAFDDRPRLGAWDRVHAAISTFVNENLTTVRHALADDSLSVQEAVSRLEEAFRYRWTWEEDS
jgi:hypothetical protein